MHAARRQYRSAQSPSPPWVVTRTADTPIDADAPVRPCSPDERRLHRDLRLRALADSPDALGSTLEPARPEVDWAERLHVGARPAAQAPILVERGVEAVRLAWGRLEGDATGVAHLFQMWVAPEHCGYGPGRDLLSAPVTLARAAGAHTLELGVTYGDTPAMRLCTRAGFRPAGEPHPLRPGSALHVQPLHLPLTESDVPSLPPIVS